jgi:2-oxoglutarate dehydrogenase complex dehydrogenase (E1) component-like enzyme
VSKNDATINANSYLFGGNAPYVEELYEAYLNNPGSVPDNWRAYFDACSTCLRRRHRQARRGPLVRDRLVRRTRQAGPDPHRHRLADLNWAASASP